MISEKGMTIMEVLLALALSSIIISLLFMIFSLFTDAYKNSINAMDAQYSARMVIFNISRDIRSAYQIELAGDEKIIITGKSKTVSYYMENEVVYHHENKTKIPIAEKVGRLTFSQQGLVITITVAAGAPGHEYCLNAACLPRAAEN